MNIDQIDRLNTHVAELMSIATHTNWSHRNHWPAITDDTPENRDELRRRIRAVFDNAARSSMWQGEGRLQVIKQWAEKNL